MKIGDVSRVFKDFYTNPTSKKVLKPTENDSFIRTTSTQSTNNIDDKTFLDELFGEHGVEREFNKLSQLLGLKHPPTLYIDSAQAKSNEVFGGLYDFTSNIIYINLQELKGDKKKLCVIKDNQEYTMFDPLTNIPLIAEEKDLKEYLAINNFKKNKYIMKPVSKDDLRKFFVQKLAHELIHAKQHEIMARTEGIGAKAVILNKGRAHYENKPQAEKLRIQQKLENEYNNSCWSKFNDIENTIKRNSAEGIYATNLARANETYINNPNVPEYYENLLEKQAYRNSFEYVVSTMGSY